MQKGFSVAAACAVLLLVGGCSKSADSLIREQIGIMNEMADAMERGDSQSDLEAKFKARTESCQKQLEALKLSDEQKRELEQRYREKMAEALGRMMKAAMARMSKEMGSAMPGMPNLPMPAANPGFPNLPVPPPPPPPE